MTIKTKAIVPALCLTLTVACFAARPAHADLVQVFSRADLSANDEINWGTLGGNGTHLSNPFDITSNEGLAASVDKRTSSGDFQLLVQGASGGWAGNFSPGDTILWTNYYPDYAPNAITIHLADSVSAIGANIQQANAIASFTGVMALFDPDNVFLGQVSVTAASNSNGDGSAAFLGVRSSETNIRSVIFYVSAAPFNYIGSYGINQVGLVRPMAAPVPEPSTLASGLSAGLLVAARLLLARRRKRRSTLV